MIHEPCLNCGSLAYTRMRTSFVVHPEDVDKPKRDQRFIKHEVCNQCPDKVMQSDGWRDADGQKLDYKDIPGIWHTLGRPINSARELSEHAKRNNLTQRGEIRGKPC